MESSNRLKSYIAAVYLKLYTSFGAILLPLMAVIYIGKSHLTIADLPPIAYYLAILIIPIFDDPTEVSQALKKIAANRTPRVKRHETIQYSILIVTYCLPFILPRDFFPGINLWQFLLGPIFIVIIYFLRPGNFRLNKAS